MCAVEDLSLFHHSAHSFVTNQNVQLAQRVPEGPAAFDSLNQITTADAVEALLRDIIYLDCDGFIPWPKPSVALPYPALALPAAWLKHRSRRFPETSD